MGWEKWDSSDETRRARHHSKETGPMEKQRGAMEQHRSSAASALERAGLVKKVLCFRNCRPRSTPSCPATRAGLQQTALHDGRSQQRAVVRCWWPLHPSLHADADTALDRWDSPACPNSPNNASRQFTNSRRAPHRKRGARRFSIPKGSACQAAAGWPWPRAHIKMFEGAGDLANEG